jgi:hypothetical protein
VRDQSIQFVSVSDLRPSKWISRAVFCLWDNTCTYACDKDGKPSNNVLTTKHLPDWGTPRPRYNFTRRLGGKVYNPTTNRACRDHRRSLQPARDQTRSLGGQLGIRRFPLPLGPGLCDRLPLKPAGCTTATFVVVSALISAPCLGILKIFRLAQGNHASSWGLCSQTGRNQCRSWS